MASSKSPSADKAAPTGPVHVPDAGALFQKDRSGDPRIATDTEGKVNFASFSKTLQAPTVPEAA